MSYPLNRESFDISLRFWLERFFYTKLVGLTAHRVKDKAVFAQVIQDIQSGGLNSIDEIRSICKRARKIGLLGINTYANPLFTFYEYCMRLGFSDMREIHVENVQEFLSIYTANLSLTTIRNYQFALTNFFDFIQRQNTLENGAAHIYNMDIVLSKRSVSHDLPEFLTEAELNAFLNALKSYDIKQKHINSVVRLRNQLIILMIVYSGARVSEILEIGYKDVSLEGDYYVLRLRGKGNKMRIVFIAKTLIEEYYNNWVALRANFPHVADDMPLFVNKKFHVPAQSYIYVVIENLLLSAGIRKAKNGAHLLRHSFATMLYNKSKDLILVQESLGHSSVETSRIYTHFDNQRLKHAANVISNIENSINNGGGGKSLDS
ncbi:site-specific recombinase [Helicobacter bilis]|uniref:Site-specific recombinase n=1 Tax=Helicobacter bilis TaxID=37372 RepID=A0A1Q2LJZ0_9HELI|nr:tyrosine-type recombinase/integrase [Helicobacter bilis]AQQ60262.1 site-specific recombinase [Helicobacter bilis]